MLFFFLPTAATHADVDMLIDTPQDEYMKGRVLEVQSEEEGSGETYQLIKTRILDGGLKDQEIIVVQENIRGIKPIKNIKPGDTIIVLNSSLSDPQFLLEDRYRLPSVIMIILFFFIVVIFFTFKKGLRSIISLTLNILILVIFTVPQIAIGKPPLLIALISSVFILAISLFLTHGVNSRTITSFVSCGITISLSILVGYLLIYWSKLTGTGNEEAYMLQLGNLNNIDLRGLLLAGIVISTIGIMDDVAIVQTTAVQEIHETNPLLNKKELYKRGIFIGKEHILSMVNTLFIVYAGAAIPTLLFFLYQSNVSVPLWVKLNSEKITEEIIRSIVGSIILIFTVPITTLLAVRHYKDIE